MVGGSIIFCLLIEVILNEIPEFPYSGIVDVHACSFLAYKVSFFMKVSCNTTCDNRDVLCSVYLYGSPYYSCTVMKQVGLCGNVFDFCLGGAWKSYALTEVFRGLSHTLEAGNQDTISD